MFVSGGFVYSYRKPAATVSSTSPITATREALTQSVGLLKDLFSIFGESKIMFSATSTASQETED
ncbi:MAG: hypothetical protein A2664_04235 [Candidatus Taylorbacteria bacterium RIFCSPHIGHO2_01_FULL_46_22b]|uniref:Uncharacterized protein n=1 Tax=Candidatus Taylorbacteria bacterium RIFCSPHIGHO2_01_FULL_46_22b TaxID=1802301 RepID=A0A1G2M1M3_9BACT|nr:MAG: hypothetical protein A2664_04235 [Candidatus Taylorbacteria bacterium RIFCSPHIGHO2_01_FULL_46_22b]